jgi:hypothetical protein
LLKAVHNDNAVPYYADLRLFIIATEIKLNIIFHTTGGCSCPLILNPSVQPNAAGAALPRRLFSVLVLAEINFD